MRIDIEALRKAIPTNQYYRSHLGEPQSGKYFCLFHPDKKTPNVVADEKGVHCFACGEGGDIFWFHAKLTGLPFTDVLRDLAEKYAPHLLPNNGNENGKHLKKIIATYPYQDETGKLLFQVVKYEPKDFLFRHPDSEGGWIWNLKSVRRVLYRLPILLASSGTVYIPGGEKDCETLINLGMTATTNPCGEGKWKPEFNEHLKGREVVIFEDNDQPGRKHGQVVAKSLHGIAEAVKVIAFPELPEHGDVSDYLETHTKNELYQRIEEAPVYEPSKEESTKPVSANGAELNEFMESAGIAGLSENSSPDEIISAFNKFVAVARNRDEGFLGIARSELIRKLKAIKVESPTKMVNDALKHPKSKTMEGQGKPLVVEDPEPWPEEINGAELLDEIKVIIQRYIVLPKWGAEAVSLWIMHAWTLDAFYLSPILRITSPTKACGKSLLLILVQALLPRGYSTANLTTAAMFRLVDQYQISLCVDEADQSFKNNDDLVSIVNAGYLRKTSTVPRCGGDNHELQIFSAWCPKVIAGIGNLSETTESRCIEIRLEKKIPEEMVEKLSFRTLDAMTEPICKKAARWSEDNIEALSTASPDIPKELEDRPENNWSPLIAIADIAGGEWSQKARNAALHLSSCNEEEEIPAVQLLRDMSSLFQDRGVDRIPSAELATYLAGMEERPWPEFNKGNPITARQIARQLKRFGIIPKTIRTSEGTPKGYLLDNLKDAFSRYTPPLIRHSDTSQQTKDLEDFLNATSPPDVADKKQLNLLQNNDCGGVADRNRGLDENKLT